MHLGSSGPLTSQAKALPHLTDLQASKWKRYPPALSSACRAYEILDETLMIIGPGEGSQTEQTLAVSALQQELIKCTGVE